MEGCGELQTFDVALAPGWAEVTVKAIPKGAEVRIDGSLVGQTPLDLDLFPGSYKLEISADRFKPYRTKLLVRTTRRRVLDQVRLEPADGTFMLHTNPSGANVMVGGIFVGKSPLNVPLLPDREHVIRISKAGYENVVRKVKVSSAKVGKLDVNLTPIEGIVYLEVDPGDAELIVNGKSLGRVRRELRLTSIEHRLEITKEGYESFHFPISVYSGQLSMGMQNFSCFLKPRCKVFFKYWRMNIIGPVITKHQNFGG